MVDKYVADSVSGVGAALGVFMFSGGFATTAVGAFALPIAALAGGWIVAPILQNILTRSRIVEKETQLSEMKVPAQLEHTK
ncbi:MAG: hypothetical protein ACRD3W_11505, partial [Terriglobales bacterium]